MDAVLRGGRGEVGDARVAVAARARSAALVDCTAQIARAVETIFDVEVAKVNVRNSKHGKHASVKLAEGYDAEDAAMRLGAF